MRPPILVLGLGNELFSDEGIGIVAARRIQDREYAGVEVIDGGTLGLMLLPEVEGRESLLVLDALVAEGARPGDVIVLEDDDVYQGRQLLFSAHQVGLSEVLAAAELAGRAPARVAAVGMVPASLETGYGVSATAEEALDDMVAAAAAILETWGVREIAHA